jgi:hypothetical protein
MKFLMGTGKGGELGIPEVVVKGSTEEVVSLSHRR